jgi:hypothetical protein
MARNARSFGEFRVHNAEVHDMTCKSVSESYDRMLFFFCQQLINRAYVTTRQTASEIF